jgi:hypothetical protein
VASEKICETVSCNPHTKNQNGTALPTNGREGPAYVVESQHRSKRKHSPILFNQHYRASPQLTSQTPGGLLGCLDPSNSSSEHAWPLLHAHHTRRLHLDLPLLRTCDC